MLCYIITSITVLTVVVCDAPNEDLTLVETNTGPVRGKIMTGLTQKDVRAFFAIPYAEPPIGGLRFRPPASIASWTQVFDATRVPLPCYQQYTKVSLSLSRKLNSTVRRPWSEDCLTLNIWTPVEVPPDTPVVVFFHGGDFTTGTGSFPHLDLSTTSAESNAIMISINYRLGSFGFLSLGVTDIPGNLGLMDQHLALKWIHQNVAQFGGKNSAIFLYGYEAGAASIGHQLILPENKGLFVTVFLMGGFPTCEMAWQTKENAVKLGRSLSQAVGCDLHNLTEVIECLQAVDPEDIIDASLALGGTLNTDTFRPNIDGSFIKEIPRDAIKEGRLNKVNIFISNGLNARSLNFFNLNEDLLTKPRSGLNVRDFQKAIERSGLAQSDTEIKAISEWYLGADCALNELDVRDAAIQVYSDGGSICCAEEMIALASQKGLQTYKYVVGFPDPRFPNWIGGHDKTFWLLYTGKFFGGNFSSEILRASKILQMRHRKGLRASITEFQKLAPVYDLVDRPYMFWNIERKHLKHHRTNECVLWNEILPAMRKLKRSCSK